jgi:hypothetical protein
MDQTTHGGHMPALVGTLRAILAEVDATSLAGFRFSDNRAMRAQRERAQALLAKIDAEGVLAAPAGPFDSIPRGWQVDVSWFHDECPCVMVALTRDHGRVRHEGHGTGADLGVAMASATQEALSSLSVQAAWAIVDAREKAASALESAGDVEGAAALRAVSTPLAARPARV